MPSAETINAFKDLPALALVTIIVGLFIWAIMRASRDFRAANEAQATGYRLGSEALANAIDKQTEALSRMSETVQDLRGTVQDAKSDHTTILERIKDLSNDMSDVRDMPDQQKRILSVFTSDFVDVCIKVGVLPEAARDKFIHYQSPARRVNTGMVATLVGAMWSLTRMFR